MAIILKEQDIHVRAEKPGGEGKWHRLKVWTCEDCGEREDPTYEMWRRPDGLPQASESAESAQIFHDALCPYKLDHPKRANERDRQKVLETLFARANTLLGQSPDVARKALARLYEWTPEQGPPASFKKSPYYAKGNEDQPFLSEAYLYPLLGKEDARTLLALLGAVATAVGYERGMGQ